MTDREPLKSILEFIKNFTYRHPLTISYDKLYIVLQTEYREKYGWSIIDEKTLELVKNHIIGKKTLEINCGKGFWTYCLRLLSCDIVATDLLTQDSSWIAVEKLDAVSAVEKYNEECSVLLCCWPDYEKEYAYEAISRFTGDTIIYIGEDKCGNCATDSFFDYLTQNYQKLEIENTLQSWPFLNDRLSIYKKK
jgi:hypothetical protein